MAIQLQDKWQRVCTYSGLTDEDLQLLHTHQSLFESTKDRVVDQFYDVLETHPNLVAIVEANSTISRLKQTQLWYYASLGERDIHDAYIAGREKIGLVHARIGLSPDWYMSATTLYLRLFSDVVAGHEQELELIRAFSRRLMFDAAVILQQYDNAYRDNMKTVATQVENSMAEVSEIASEYAASAEFLSQSQETINQSMKQLVLYSQDIEKVSRLVMGVADQTHLLGLNAAIESARAGEHGRGFAVVAGEVRKLSEEVMKSSKDIQDSIHRIISQVQAMSDQVTATLQISTDQTAAAEELSALINQVESFTQTWSQQAKK